MVELKHIYVVGAPSDERFASLGRSWEDPARIRAFARIEDAVLAEATGDVCVPGYFAGEADPMPMASASPTEVAKALRTAGFEEYLYISDGEGQYAGEVWLEPQDTALWVESLTAVQAQVLRLIFDRHADPSVVGRRSIYEVEVR